MSGWLCLRPPNYIQSHDDDIESGLHLLAYYGLRFMPHKVKNLESVIAMMYHQAVRQDWGTKTFGGDGKRTFITTGHLPAGGSKFKIRRNDPYTDLLETLRKILMWRYANIGGWPPPNADVPKENALKQALAPEQDHALEADHAPGTEAAHEQDHAPEPDLASERDHPFDEAPQRGASSAQDRALAHDLPPTQDRGLEQDVALEQYDASEPGAASELGDASEMDDDSDSEEDFEHDDDSDSDSDLEPTSYVVDVPALLRSYQAILDRLDWPTSDAEKKTDRFPKAERTVCDTQGPGSSFIRQQEVKSNDGTMRPSDRASGSSSGTKRQRVEALGGYPDDILPQT
jgi:hypothetical protein